MPRKYPCQKISNLTQLTRVFVRLYSNERVIHLTSAVAPADRKRRRYGGPSTDQEDLWVQFSVDAELVIPKTLKMGVVPACMVLMMKWRPRSITGQPGVSIL